MYIDGHAQPHSLVALLRENPGVVPPFPGPSLIQPARVPFPPLVDLDAPLPDRVRALVDVYGVQLRRKFSARARPLMRGGVQQMKDYVDLCVATYSLSEHKIAPASWCAFSMDVWRERSPKTPPRIAWVYGCSRLDERRWWFHQEQGRYEGGQTHYGEQHLALVRRWYAMQKDLVASCDTGVAAVVAKHFEPGEYKMAVDQCVLEAKRLQQIVNEQCARGEWSW